MSRGGLNWMWNAWWVLADSIVQRRSLGGKQRHCSSVLIEFDSTTGGGKKNVLLLSFRTERGPFSVTPTTLTLTPTNHLTHQPALPSLYHPVLFFSPCTEMGCSFLLTTCSPEITLYFIELILEMTTEEFHFNAMSSLLAFYCFSSATEQTPPPSTDFRGALWILKTLLLFKFSLESTDVIKFNLNCSDYVTSVFIYVGLTYACAWELVSVSVLLKMPFVLFCLASGSPSPLNAANPSFNANDSHQQSNASFIAAHCLINVKCCVKKYIASL